MVPVAAGLVAGSALRQISRSLKCSPNTVVAIASRLGRHAMLLQSAMIAELRGGIAEPVVLDHFETFEFTHDYPFGVATAVGARSWFWYALDPAPHSRAGRRTELQARRLMSRPKRATKGRYLGSVARVLALLVEIGSESTLHLISDGHTDYRRAVRQCPKRHRIEHSWFPNPKRGPKGSARGRAARERDAALFAVDLLHKILRHTLAHHRRKTIAFPRRLNAAMERLCLTAIWRNLIKGRSERRSRSPTPAMVLGLTDQRWDWDRTLAQRLFFDHARLSAPWPQLYRREWTTPVFDNNSVHRRRNAF